MKVDPPSESGVEGVSRLLFSAKGAGYKALYRKCGTFSTSLRLKLLSWMIGCLCPAAPG